LERTEERALSYRLPGSAAKEKSAMLAAKGAVSRPCTSGGCFYNKRMTAMPAMPPSITEIGDAVRLVCSKHPVERVQVFGSAASGKAHAGSDVDLLIEFQSGARIGLLEMGGIKEELEELLGCQVDLLSRAAVERSRNPYRRESILAAPVTVYAR
jgi:predicted nucleotidyltransferase